MPISCHFRDCKALLVASLTHVRGATASTQPLPSPFTKQTDGQTERETGEAVLTGEASEVEWKSFEEVVSCVNETSEEQATHAGDIERRVGLRFQLTQTIATDCTTV